MVSQKLVNVQRRKTRRRNAEAPIEFGSSGAIEGAAFEKRKWDNGALISFAIAREGEKLVVTPTASPENASRIEGVGR
jgi:hypothetical protein